jgi:oligopeptide/dipeptide ABC transporter ATP-binding protein
MSDGEPLLELEDVVKEYRGGVRALAGVSLALAAGRTLGIVGESGCGKSTIARLALALEQPTSGGLRFAGAPYPRSPRALRPIRRRIAMVFQDPYDSLDALFTLRAIVAEPLRAHGLPHGDEVIRELLARVGMADAPLDSYAAAYSGGQRQRIGIARALAVAPELLVCDEPTSALDVSVQAQILNLLLELQRERNLAYLFISHDLEVVRRMSDAIAVIYAGTIVERGAAQAVTEHPRHPYTQALLAAVPASTPAERRPMPGRGAPGAETSSVPKIGCPFAPRCPRALERCTVERPALLLDDDRELACFSPYAALGEASASSAESAQSASARARR